MCVHVHMWMNSFVFKLCVGACMHACVRACVRVCVCVYVCVCAWL